jgi:hypothetical protein
MNVLALDMATRTGFSALKGGRLFSGVWENPHRCGGSPGAFFAAWRAWLADAGRWYEPQIVAFEFTAGHSRACNMVAYGMASRVYEWAWARQIETAHVAPNTLKKFITGHGRAEKEEVREIMRKRWKLPRLMNLDESDALAVLNWAVEKNRG